MPLPLASVETERLVTLIGNGLGPAMTVGRTISVLARQGKSGAAGRALTVPSTLISPAPSLTYSFPAELTLALLVAVIGSTMLIALPVAA